MRPGLGEPRQAFPQQVIRLDGLRDGGCLTSCGHRVAAASRGWVRPRITMNFRMTAKSRPTPDGEWRSPTHPPQLEADTVEVWRVDLDAPRLDTQQMRAALPVGELRRADALRGEVLRHRFLAAHSALRHILAAYLNCSPKDLIIEAGANGKPYLGRPSSPAPLHFNLAHSANLALCAFAHVEVGIDVEQLRPVAQIEGAAPGVLSAEEMSLATPLAAEDRQEALHWLWTCKEAYVKATGTGLRLDVTHVTLLPELPNNPSSWLPLNSPLGQVTARLLTPREGFFAALVVMGAPLRLRCSQFSAQAFGQLSIDG